MDVEHTTVKKLGANGIVTQEIVAITYEPELSIYTDQNRHCDSRVGVITTTAEEVLRRRGAVFRITSGSKAFDKLLNGGFESQAITELIGESGSGKSQIAHTLCVLVQLPEHRGGLGDCRVLFIDTDGTFSPERIVQIASSRCLLGEKTLKNILISRVNSSKYLAYVMDEARKIIPSQNIKLLIVDSLTSCFQGERGESQSATQKLQKLNRILNRLHQLSQTFNIPVLVTNRATTVLRPSEKDLLPHVFSYRIWLTRGKHGSRVAYLYSGISRPNSTASFKISSKGIEDLTGNKTESVYENQEASQHALYCELKV